MAMATTVAEEVGKRVADGGGELQERVIATLANREMASRESALLEAIGKVEQLRAALRKVKPDQTLYDADGKVAQAYFSKAKADEKKKLEEQLAKLDALIDKAFTKTPDFAAMRKAVEQVKVGKPDAADDKDDPSAG